MGIKLETRKDKLENLEFRSENVQDILTTPPHWMIQWGNTLIFIILLTIFVMSYFLKYPEFISAPIFITSQNPPEKLESRTNSKIEKIFIKNGEVVNENEVLMVLQSSANYEDILKLKNIVDSLNQNQIFSFPVNEVSKYKLGELQSDYNIFSKAFQDEKLFSKLQPYGPENLAANQSLTENRSRIAILQQQRQLEVSKLDLSKKNYDRSQTLFDQGVISKMELENEKIKYLQAEQNLKNLNISLSQSEESINNLNKTKSGATINSEKDKINYSSTIVQSFEQLRKSLKQWELAYLIISSTNGKVSFQQFWGENQFLKAGDVILSILPNEKSAIVGRMFVPTANSGKIIPGQKVLIKLDNYKYQEFGIVEGKVQNISLTPDKDGNYYVDVILPKGLKTSYNKTLPFDKELKGNAEIVTQDLRLIERFFYQIRKLLGYQS